MNRNDLRLVLPGAVLLATFGLVACDGGGNAGMGGVDQEGVGTGTGTYEDQNPYQDPAVPGPDTRTPAEQQQSLPNEAPIGAGGIDDDQMGGGTGDAWDTRQEGTIDQPVDEDANQPDGADAPVLP